MKSSGAHQSPASSSMSSSTAEPKPDEKNSAFKEMIFHKKARLTTLLFPLKPGFLRSKSASSSTSRPIPEENDEDSRGPTPPWDELEEGEFDEGRLSKTHSDESLTRGKEMHSCHSLPLGIEGSLASGPASSSSGSKSMTMPRGGDGSGRTAGSGGPSRRLGMRRGSSMTDIDRLAAHPKLLASGFHASSPVSESGSSSPAMFDKRRSANALSGQYDSWSVQSRSVACSLATSFFVHLNQ